MIIGKAIILTAATMYRSGGSRLFLFLLIDRIEVPIGYIATGCLVTSSAMYITHMPREGNCPLTAQVAQYLGGYPAAGQVDQSGQPFFAGQQYSGAVSADQSYPSVGPESMLTPGTA